MADALSVDVQLNAQQAVADAKKLGTAFKESASDMEDLVDAGKDLGKSTDDIAKDLSKAGDGRPFDDIRRDVEKADDALDDLGDEADGTRKDLDKLSDAGDDIGDKTRRGTEKAQDGIKGIGDEAGQTSREVAASFDGSAESIAEAFQEVAANAFAGFGAAGLIAGSAVAMAMGAIVSAVQTAEEAYNDAKDSAYEFAFAQATAGGFGDSISRINELTGSVEKMKEIQDIATISGWDQVAVIQAMATGDGMPALTAAFNEGANSTTIATNRALELTQSLAGVTDGFATGTAGAQVQAEALYDLAVKSGIATGAVDAVGNAIYELPGGKQVVVDAVTGQAHEDLSAVENRRLNAKQVWVQVNVDDGAWVRWQPSAKYGKVYSTNAGSTEWF